MSDLLEKTQKALKKCLGKNSTCEGCPYLGTACTDHLLQDCSTVIDDLLRSAPNEKLKHQLYEDARVIDELYYRLCEVCRQELMTFEAIPPERVLFFARDTLEYLEEEEKLGPVSTRSFNRQKKLLSKFIQKWGPKNV